MPADVIIRRATAQTFLRILNSRLFARVFKLMGKERIVEFDIRNLSMIVKIYDPDKASRLMQGREPKTTPGLTSFGKQFPYGRFNTVQISMIINTFNAQSHLKRMLGYEDDEVIQTLTMNGSSVLINGVNKKELEQERQQQQQRTRQRFRGR